MWTGIDPDRATGKRPHSATRRHERSIDKQAYAPDLDFRAGERTMQQGPQGATGPGTVGMPGRMMPGFRWRSIASIIIGFGWLIFILLFAGFWAERFTLFQNVVIFFASVVTAIGLLAVMWAAWGMKWVR